jgi:hypothetical protein
MKPDLQLLKKHVGEAQFIMGIEDGKWGILDFHPELPTWPFIFFWVKAREKTNHPDKYFFRFDLSGYPELAPTACPWDPENNTPLQAKQWPKGPKQVSKVFNPAWNANALYAPCDRLAMSGHELWRTVHPNLWWQSSFKIIIYLTFIFRLLNSEDYASS